MYRHDVVLERLNWEKVKKEAELYELQLPKDLSKIPKGVEEEWKKTLKTSSSWRSSEYNISLIEVTEVFQNQRQTIKIMVAGDHRLCMFPRHAGASGWLGIEPKRDENFDLFANIKKGTWLIAQPPWRHESSRLSVNFIVNDTKDNVLKMLEAIFHIYSLQDKFSYFHWTNEQTQIPTWSTVTFQEVMQKRMVFDKALRKFRWYHRKKLWDKDNAEKKNLRFKKTKTSMVVQVKGLDGATYKVNIPKLPTENSTTSVKARRYSSYRDTQTLEKEHWSKFCWRDPDEEGNFLSQPKLQLGNALTEEMFGLLSALPNTSMMLSRNKRSVRVTRKVSTSGASLNYLDGKIVADVEVKHKIRDWFLKGIPVIASSAQAIQTQTNQQMQNQIQQKPTGKTFAQKLEAEGLNGEIRDLEGRFPFHLNILKKDRKWYIEIAGQEYHVPGGITALRKIKSAIEGTAVIDHDELGYERRATRVVRKRLGELIGQDEALKVVIQVKQMGAMFNAMNGGK